MNKREENYYIYPDRLLAEDVKYFVYTYNNRWTCKEISNNNSMAVPSSEYILNYIIKHSIYAPVRVIENVVPPFAYLRIVNLNGDPIAPAYFLTDVGEKNDTKPEAYKKLWKLEDSTLKNVFQAHRILLDLYPIGFINLNELPLSLALNINKLTNNNNNNKIPVCIIIKMRARLYTYLYGYLAGEIELSSPFYPTEFNSKYVCLDTHLPTNKNNKPIKTLIKDLLDNISSICLSEGEKAVFIVGEPSSGKEFVKNALCLGKSYFYNQKKFKTINAGGIDIQKILFNKILKEIDDGSLFIDEFCKTTQVETLCSALLRVLEAGEFFDDNGMNYKFEKKPFFIFADTPKLKSKINNPDFWTRVRVIRIPKLTSLLSLQIFPSGWYKNLCFSFLIRAFEEKYQVDNLRKGNLSPSWYEIIDNKRKKYLGYWKDNIYQMGTYWMEPNNQENFYNKCKGSNIREIRRKVYAYLENILREDGKNEKTKMSN